MPDKVSGESVPGGKRMTEDEVFHDAHRRAEQLSDGQMIRHIYVQLEVGRVQRQSINERLDKMEAQVGMLLRYLAFGRGAAWVLGSLVALGAAVIAGRDQIASALQFLTTMFGPPK